PLRVQPGAAGRARQRAHRAAGLRVDARRAAQRGAAVPAAVDRRDRAGDRAVGGGGARAVAVRGGADRAGRERDRAARAVDGAGGETLMDLALIAFVAVLVLAIVVLVVLVLLLRRAARETGVVDAAEPQ